jgi:outer membrane immunogenic protein
VVPNLLAYGTGGFGWAHSKIDSGPFVGAEASVSQPGWVAGGGLEYRIFGPLLARAEYLHYGLGSQSISPNTAFAFPSGDTLKESIDVVRGGLSYKF